MNTYQLEYFVAVADYRSFSKASQKMHISQPAITKSIKALETELMFPLFIRNSRSVALTEPGLSFYNDVKKVLEILRGSIEKAQSLSLQTTRVIRIGTSMPENLVYLASFIRQFHKDYPDIVVTITKKEPENLLSLMRFGSIDAIIDDSSSIDDLFGVDSIPIRFCPIVALVNRSNPLSHKDVLTAKDIEGQKIIMPSPSTRGQLANSEFGQWLSSLNAKEFVHVDSVEMMQSLLLVDEGIAFPPKYLRNFLEELCQIPLEVNINAELDLFYPKNITDPIMECFLKEAEEYYCSIHQTP